MLDLAQHIADLAKRGVLHLPDDHDRSGQYMATVKKGTLTSAPQWWKHLRDWKRVFWKRERRVSRRDAENRARNLWKERGE